MAGHYRAPVYLCGSALGKPDPRDYDLRVTLPDREFEERYGGTVGDWIEQGHTGAWQAVRWAWSADCTKRAKRGRRLTGLNVDFQVYSASYVAERYAEAPRVRLDERPDAARKPANLETVEPRGEAHLRAYQFSDPIPVDGDTITAHVLLTVRLVFVDCPELGTPEGAQAREFTAAWLARYAKSARMVPMGVDSYGRVLVRVTRRGGPSLGQALLDAGLAERGEV
jgi:endonuclease YncB( thermonuclease family)